MTKIHLILGSSAASIGVLGKLRKLCPDDTIICLTAQAEMPYNTCLLADYLSEGTPPKTLWTKTAAFFSENRIEFHRNHRVTHIDATGKIVTCDNGTTFAYDTLFIGTGTTQRKLQVSQPVKSGLFGFQTLEDTAAMDNLLSKSDTFPQTALVIGAGLSGVECADALTERGYRSRCLNMALIYLHTG